MNYLNYNKSNAIYFHEDASVFPLLARNICSEYDGSDAIFLE